MANLLEVEYEKIFSPKTMAALKGKSKTKSYND
jgi:hypothetical protein